MIYRIKNVKFSVFATVCLLVICVFDFFISPDIVLGILYLTAILLVIQESRKVILSFLIIASLMNMMNFIFFAANTSSLYWVYLTNSIIVMFGLCITTIVILKYKKVQDLLKAARNNNQKKTDPIAIKSYPKAKTWTVLDLQPNEKQ